MNEILYTAELKGKLTLSKYGEWYHEGKVFQRKKLSDLFHRSLIWDSSLNAFFIQIGQQRATFSYEDTVFFVTFLDVQKAPWQIALAGGGIEPLSPETLAVGAENQFYCRISNGHLARFCRNAHQELLKHVVSVSEIEINGKIFALGKR